jgi:hypothetical protein
MRNANLSFFLLSVVEETTAASFNNSGAWIGEEGTIWILEAGTYGQIQ